MTVSPEDSAPEDSAEAPIESSFDASDTEGVFGSVAPDGGRPNAAIFYHPDGYDTSRPKLVGRHAAGEGFLRGFVRHSGVETFYCHALRQRSFDHFKELVTDVRPDAAMDWIPSKERHRLAGPGCLFVPGPGIGGDYAWLRRQVGDRRYSLCGVFHTTATHAIMDAMRDILLDPVHPWDAVICTSRVVRHSMTRVLEGYQEQFASRLGARRFTLPQMPVIPLGVECERFEPDDKARARWREKLGIGEDDVVVLFVGRLSFYEKAHPLPMYLALEQAAKASKRKVHLIESGWFPNDKIESGYEEAIAHSLDKVTHHFLDGREQDVRREIWFAADIFCSLSDNIQETFGLTPIEGMAAGLPVVVSDWDGYRDTVRHEIDGFRIPTIMPTPGFGGEMADRYFERDDGYARYCGYASQLVVVDVPATVEAFKRLIEDPELRRKMGEAGRERARSVLDWRVVIGQYQALWEELTELRQAGLAEAPEQAPAMQRHPGRDCPFSVFRSYPSEQISRDHLVTINPDVSAEQVRSRIRLRMVSFAKDILPPESLVTDLIQHLAMKGPATVQHLAERVPEVHQRSLVRTVLWLGKHDLVRITKT